MIKLDYQKAISTKELIKAARQCAKNVSWKESVSEWLVNIELRASVLHQQLVDGTYRIQPYGKLFLSGPKPRHIHCTKFTDRVVQRSLCNNGLYDVISNSLLSTNCACLKDKGITFCENLVVKNLQHYYFSNNRRLNDAWYLKADIKHFFDSTPHCILKRELQDIIYEQNFLKHVYDIIDSFVDCRPIDEICNDPFGERGVYLGSQISQLIQLIVLNKFDHKISNLISFKSYIRYMDDMIIFFPTKDEAETTLKIMDEELKKYGFELNSKTKIGRVKDGFKFLNINFRLTDTGRVVKKMNKNRFGRELSRIVKLLRLFKDGKITEFYLIQHFNSWFGSHKLKMKRNQFRKAKRFVSYFIEEIFKNGK